MTIQIDISVEDPRAPHQGNPERDLAAGVLHQSILDWRRWPGEIEKLEEKLTVEKETENRHALRLKIDAKKRGLAAVQRYLFVNDDESYIYSFRSICTILDLDPGQVREALKRGDGER